MKIMYFLALYQTQSPPWEGKWLSNTSTLGLSQLTENSSPCLYSLKHANRPSSSTSSIIKSNFATVSTSNEAKAAKGNASENSRLVITILLIWLLNALRSCSCLASFVCSADTLLLFQSNKAEESVLTLESEFFPWEEAMVASMLLAWMSLEPKKSRGCDFMAVLRSCNASQRLLERISGEQWRLLFMLLASSISTFDTSAASLMQGSLKRTRTDLGVWK